MYQFDNPQHHNRAVKYVLYGFMLSVICTSHTTLANKQHNHQSKTSAHKKAKQAQAIISPIMMLLDDIDRPGVDVCTVMSNIANGAYDFGATPQAIDDIPSKVAEHNAIFDFVGHDKATHLAINSGRWSNSRTWYKGRVPGDCANVVIPESVSVTYDRELDARLNTVRVDGSLIFSNRTSSRMIVDTLVVDPRGYLEIGTQSNPVQANATIEIVIANNGDIDVSDDPMLLSRGMVAHGQTVIHGAKKQSHIKVLLDPNANSDTITLAQAPLGWKVGDTIVVAGTRYSGWKWDNSIRAVRYFDSQDEVRSITRITGNTLKLNQPLHHNHHSPRADLKTSVANYSRNVVFKTENADQVPVHQRGHVMFMHTNKVDVRYAAFQQLGRTDKSVPSFDVPDLNPVQSDSNARGRYSLHLHRIGTTDKRSPAVIVGNAVFGSPGWGYTHHDSHAIFTDNASFDTFGAGFVAETGNETGVWSGNIAIKGEGNRAINPKNGNEREAFDIARNGVGFWFQGRMVRSTDNIAASLNNAYAYLHRGTGMLNFPAENFMFPEALDFNPETTPDDPPIRNFDNNEAFASTVGLYIVKANPDQGHDVYTVLSNFTGWNVRHGMGMEYTSHYLVTDADLMAAPEEPFARPNWGIELGTNTSDMVIRNARINGFPVGMHLSKHYTNPSDVGHDQYVIIEPTFINVSDHYEENDDSDTFISNSDLQESRFDLQLTKTNGRFEYLNAGGDGRTHYNGIKTDSIGESPVPAGTDDLDLHFRQMVTNLTDNGYRMDPETGDHYSVVENYFSDRATGEVHKFGMKTHLGASVVSRLGNPFFSFANAVNKGAIDLGSQPPITTGDQATTQIETDVQITLTNNDSDPDDDALRVDGILQPRNGMVFKDSDTAVTYRPLPNFIGNDSFEYWATDDQGNYSKGRVTVTVTP